MKKLALLGILVLAGCGVGPNGPVQQGNVDDSSLTLISPSAPGYIQAPPGVCKEMPVGGNTCTPIADLKQQMLNACPAPRVIGGTVLNGTASCPADQAMTLEFQCCDQSVNTNPPQTQNPGSSAGGTTTAAGSCVANFQSIAPSCKPESDLKTEASNACAALGMSLTGIGFDNTGCSAPGEASAYKYACCPAGGTTGNTGGTTGSTGGTTGSTGGTTGSTGGTTGSTGGTTGSTGGTTGSTGGTTGSTGGTIGTGGTTGTGGSTGTTGGTSGVCAAGQSSVDVNAQACMSSSVCMTDADLKLCAEKLCLQMNKQIVDLHLGTACASGGTAKAIGCCQ